MTTEHFRYFIEIYQPIEAGKGPAEAMRQRQLSADGFRLKLQVWLEECHLAALVSKLSTTLMGQVEILCDPEVIDQMRSQHLEGITTIRASGNGSIGTARLGWGQPEPAPAPSLAVSFSAQS